MKRETMEKLKMFYRNSYQTFFFPPGHISLFISFLSENDMNGLHYGSSLQMHSFSNEPLCLEVTFLYLFCLPIALIKYIRPVFVSRSDQNSRKKTVEEIKRRAHSGAEWPQVKR